MSDDLVISAENGFDFALVTGSAIDDFNAAEDARLKTAVASGAAAARTSLRGDSPKDTGEYSRSWAVDSSDEDGEHVAVVYNRGRGPLTHLLVDGHESYNQYGGPYGRVGPAQPEGYMERAYERGLKVIERKLGV
jgi:hypothetical protein